MPMTRHPSLVEKENMRFVRSSLYASAAAKLMLDALICCLSFRTSREDVPLLMLFPFFLLLMIVTLYSGVGCRSDL